ncbi:MAG: aminotransferase class I/II-fold pyridoxal phosphate-dependent enzyme [Phycisphaerales bacterium]
MSQRFSSRRESRSLATTAVHGWGAPDDASPIVAPIVQSATFRQSEPGAPQAHTYSRASNPTVASLERGLAALEDADAAIAFGSGLAATHAIALAFLAQGDHAVVGQASYGGTVRLFRSVLAPLGIRATFVDTSDLRAVRDAIEPRTRLVLAETPANPTLDLVDIAAIAEIARAAGAALVVDNTFLTAVHQRPLDLGATASLLSTTKWIDGHNATIGGAVVARDPALADRLRFLRKSLGSIQAPFDAWLTLQGLKTLPLRLARHSASALEIARWLDGRDGIARVLYPGLAAHPQHALARRQHRGGHGGVVTFELDGGMDAARRFARRLEIVTLAESLGGVESLLTHPATMTHADVPSDQRSAIGLTDGLVRLSVGIESVDDLKRDLEQALAPRVLAREEVSRVG